jgi:hypothetical protein
MSHQQNAGHDHNIKTANRSFGNGEVKIFGNSNDKSKFD